MSYGVIHEANIDDDPDDPNPVTRDPGGDPVPLSCFGLGLAEGAAEGVVDGESDGICDGASDSRAVGWTVGAAVSATVGAADGDLGFA